MARLERLVDEAETILASKTTAEWIDLFRAGKVPCGKLNFPPDVFDDPQVNANEYLVEIEHPLFGSYKTFAPPIRMDATPTRVQGPPPLFDEHTDAVLAELGFAVEAVAELRALGVAGRNGSEGS